MSALSRRVANLECRRPPVRPPPSPEDEIARVRAMLIAAFGEDDFAAATAAEAEGSGRHVSAPPHPPGRVGQN